MDNHLPNLLNDSDSFEGVGDVNTDFEPQQGILLAFNPLRVQVDVSGVKCACVCACEHISCLRMTNTALKVFNNLTRQSHNRVHLVAVLKLLIISKSCH